MNHTVRPVRSDEWAEVKQLRLDALKDPVAHLAFLETYEQAAAEPDDFWRGRAARGAAGESVRQFVAQAPDGRWLGTVAALVERPGVESVLGDVPETPQTQVVGVFVRPEARGAGLAEELIEAALEWSWSLAGPRIERVRLFVHEANARAEALYGKVGFQRTGFWVPFPGDAAHREYELALRRP